MCFVPEFTSEYTQKNKLSVFSSFTECFPFLTCPISCPKIEAEIKIKNNVSFICITALITMAQIYGKSTQF